VPAAAASGAAERDRARQLDIKTKVWKGDFDGILERRAIRIYVPYSRSLYFIDKGRERGISAHLIREFERWLNKKYAAQLGKRPLTVFAIVATRDKMLAELLEGHADVAVGNIKVLDELLKDVDFIAPDESAASVEILATGPSAPAIASIDDLSGKTVHVRKVSSYYLSLTALNERLKKAGKHEVNVVLLPEALEDEDLLEMLNAGLLEATVVDDWKAKAWAPVLPKVKVREDIQLRLRIKVGWAIRKNSPKLAAELNEFWTYYAKQAGGASALLRQYASKVKALHNATAAEDRKRFRALLDYFDKYGKQYGFDPIMLAAQGYQESKLNQDVKSPVGAIGVMQVMPATGAELKVGDIIGRSRTSTPVRSTWTSSCRSTFRMQSSTSRIGRCSRSRVTTADPETSRRCAMKLSSEDSIRISGSTTSKSSLPRRSASRPRPMSATSSSTTRRTSSSPNSRPTSQR
jgi:membrane-bound lytic murein transglycosylase MltF